MRKGFLFFGLILLGGWSWATPATETDLLIKLANKESSLGFIKALQGHGMKVESIGGAWIRTSGSKNKFNLRNLKDNPHVQYVQPNYPVRLLNNYRIEDPLRREALMRFVQKNKIQPLAMPADNPPIPSAPAETTGDDPDFGRQWGMSDSGVKDAWAKTRGSDSMIVAVIDTGVDYTHEDLLPNLWRNPGETGLDSQGRAKETNGVDDDNNGYVDDTIGWDFVANDSKPFDLAVEPLQLLFGGGNPGHGTHCAGNVAARGDNGKGIAGVAPNVKIMSLRFISEKGQGTSADAIKAILYAVNNGAKVLSNSWGSEGENPAEAAENKALREAIQYAEAKGTLFVAAAGNGHQGVGYDNDADAKPGYPASYEYDTVLSVAALNAQSGLGPFSNWGPRTVDIGAPGVAVYSTTVGGKYSDVVIDQFGFKVTWDGTSMAAPHVAGAAALYWSLYPEKNFRDVKDALIRSAKKTPALQGKSVSEGRLDVKNLIENF